MGGGNRRSPVVLWEEYAGPWGQLEPELVGRRADGSAPPAPQRPHPAADGCLCRARLGRAVSQGETRRRTTRRAEQQCQISLFSQGQYGRPEEAQEALRGGLHSSKMPSH